ncbi:hypothetical protein MTX20_30125 [Bradyrhizobium sp. ISRA435]|nr:hypothetical protein MTX20_30125 [Bradyrhizobium sp. ISRA435]
MVDFVPIPDPTSAGVMLTAAQMQSGPPIDPVTRVLTYSPDEWEAFIHEWVSSLKTDYVDVARPTGGGDRGIDIAAFRDSDLLNGVWDNYQCKHYAKPISPNVALLEIGKILWHSFNGHYRPPRAYYFVAPKGDLDLPHLVVGKRGQAQNSFNRCLE